MEASVRYIRIGTEAECQSSIKPALCFRGRKFGHAVINDETTVRAVEIPIVDLDKAPLARYQGDEYPVERFLKQISNIAARKGATQRALALIARPLADEIALPPDEPADPLRRPEPASQAEARPGTTGDKGSSGAQPESSGEGMRPSRGRMPPLRPKGREATSPEPSPAAAAASKRADRPLGCKAAVPTPPKAPRTSEKSLKSLSKTESKKRSKRGTLVQQLSAELGIAEQPLRVRLRAAGLRAPYTDIEKMRKAAKVS